jgi:DNA-binding GntR family transcriptional regulator
MTSPKKRTTASLAPAADEETTASSVEQAANLIREAIAQGHLGPGTRIKITEAAERFGVGTMPVREALRKLEGEGLVNIAPNRGATVRAVDQKFVEDIYEVRTTLEVMTVAKCAQHMTLARLSTLEALVVRQRQALKSGDFAETMESSRLFHAMLLEIGGNLEAQRIFQRGWEILHTLRMQLGYSQERMENMPVEYDYLVDALRRQDATRAEAVVRMHNRAGMEDLLARLARDRQERKLG